MATRKKQLIKKSIKALMSRFFTLDEALKTLATYILLIGGRNAGKSRDTKKKAIERYKHNKKFGVIFRTDLGNETNTAIAKYFDDLKEDISKMTKGEYDQIKVKAGDLYLYKEEEDEEVEVQGKDGNWTWKTIKGNKIWGPRIGHIFFLDQEHSYKSKIYPDVDFLLFEEVFISADSKATYLKDESTRLDSLVSTIFRNTKDGKVVLIGNLHSLVNPYTSAWNIRDMYKIKEGYIQLYEIDSSCEDKKILLAVEHVKNNNQQNYALSQKGQQQEKGEWETGNYLTPKVVDLNGFSIRYEFVFTYIGFYFLCQFMVKGSDMILYITRKTSDIQPNTRVVGDIPSLSVLYTKTFKPLIDRERLVFDLLNQGKLVFGDNNIGEDFYVSLNSFKRNN